MRSNTAKQLMLQGKPALGAAAVLGAPLAAEMLSLAGFDYVLVDNQHGLFDDESSTSAFHAICLGPATPMARVRQNDYYAIGRLLDRGAMGIVVPMVNSVEDAKAAAFAVRYPPRGGRSFGPVAAGFLGPDYAARIDDEIFLAVQIETKQAVEQAEAILAVEGVDGCWIGPADLARSMGVEMFSPAHEQAIMSVLQACRKVGKIPGIAAGDRGAYWLEKGFLFVTVASDSGAINANARETLRQLRALM